RTPPSTFLFLPIQLSNSPETWEVPSPLEVLQGTSKGRRSLSFREQSEALGHHDSDGFKARRLAGAERRASGWGYKALRFRKSTPSSSFLHCGEKQKLPPCKPARRTPADRPVGLI